MIMEDEIKKIFDYEKEIEELQKIKENSAIKVAGEIAKKLENLSSKKVITQFEDGEVILTITIENHSVSNLYIEKIVEILEIENYDIETMGKFLIIKV